jgi:hypothetical protein
MQTASSPPPRPPVIVAVDDEQQRPNNNNKFSSLRRGCVGCDVTFQKISERTVKSLFWKSLIVLFTFLLLFGSPIQFWAVPAEGDVVFDGIYMTGFIIFMVDVVFNIYADPEYLVCDPCNRSLRKSNLKHVHPRIWTFGFGSFNFWCDLISSVGFLWDISFINKMEFSMHSVSIVLNEYGIPVSPMN